VGRELTNRSWFRPLLAGTTTAMLISIGPLLTAQVTRSAGEAAGPIRKGMPLAQALNLLRAQGLDLIFSTGVVTEEMNVKSNPTGDSLAAILGELLAPHGLSATEGPGGSLIVVRRAGSQLTGTLKGLVQSSTTGTQMPGVVVRVIEIRSQGITGADGRFEFPTMKAGTYTLETRAVGFASQRRHVIVRDGGATEVAFVLQPLLAEEIVVQPSRLSLLGDEAGAQLSLNREEIEALPHLGGDVFRTLSLLPGTASGGVSAEVHVRGARQDELLILLDGQELYEPYHLKDFDNALSIVGASALDRVHLMTATFPVNYGDRMAGVLSMVTMPSARRLRLEASLLGAQIDAANSHLDGRLGWLVSMRRGTTDVLGRAFDIENPRYWDFFGKLRYELTPTQSLQLHGLTSQDSLDFTPSEETKQLHTDYHSSYLWLTHRAVLGPAFFVDTTASGTRGGQDRSGAEDDGERAFDVSDERSLDVVGLTQSWSMQAGDRHFVNAGFEYQKFVSIYDYTSFRTFNTPLRVLRSEPRGGTFAFDGRFGSEHFSLYASDRIRPTDSLTLDVGIRFDRQTAQDDNVLNPRVSAAWRVGASSVLRLGWGHFSQTHRPYEVMIEDGDTRLYRAERSEHWVLGVEHVFAEGSRVPLSSLRAEAYRRDVSDPRPRYDNLFKPFDAFPEGEIDRVRLEPESAQAEGLEILARGRGTPRIEWWFSYGLASTTDRIDGRDVPRRVDQTHTMNMDVNYRPARQWNVNAAWRYHTGWPLTPLRFESAENESEQIPVLGPLNSERVSDYHRLDLRISREWQTSRGNLSVFLDGHNLYGRENIAGRDVDFDEDPIIVVEEAWPGFFASAGIIWELR